MSLIWLAAFILIVPLMVVNKQTEDGCEEIWPTPGHSQAYTVSLTIIQYVIPLLITAICYIRIWRFLKSRPVLPNNSGLTSARENSWRRNHERKHCNTQDCCSYRFIVFASFIAHSSGLDAVRFQKYFFR